MFSIRFSTSSLFSSSDLGLSAMSTKEPITLDECCRYVGLYLHNWALMESNLNELLEKAFGIDALQGLILTRNIQFRDKIHIARTIVARFGAGYSNLKMQLLTMLFSCLVLVSLSGDKSQNSSRA